MYHEGHCLEIVAERILKEIVARDNPDNKYTQGKYKQFIH